MNSSFAFSKFLISHHLIKIQKSILIIFFSPDKPIRAPSHNLWSWFACCPDCFVDRLWVGVLKHDTGHRMGTCPHIPPTDLPTITASSHHMGILGAVREAGQGTGCHKGVTVLGGVLNVESVAYSITSWITIILWYNLPWVGVSFSVPRNSGLQ